MRARELHLNVNLLHSGVYPSAWRLPGSQADAFVDIAHFIRVAHVAERGKLDAIFFADTPAINDRLDYRPLNALEPTIVLASVAAATRHIGLIATASTSYNEPYNLARRFASLDLVSGGRAGWNVVTTGRSPSWKVTPARSVKVYSVPSGEIVHCVASQGAKLPSGLLATRESM